jgi:STE24 endopeptidase
MLLSMIRLLCIFLLGLGLHGAAYAEESNDLSLKAAAIAPVDEVWRAALPKDPEAATEAYMARLTPAAKARSDAYFEGGYWLQLWNLLLGLLIAWLLLGTGLSAKMRDIAERFSRRKPLQTIAYGVLYLLISWVISLPLTIYQGFFREHQYGLATQTFGPWFGEQLISLLVSLLAGGVFLVALYAVIRRAPNTWWVWGSIVTTLLLAFFVMIAPVYIEPLFNAYKPLEAGEIKTSILSMARANGVPANDVFEFDASKQTTRISANVAGLLGTTRIALNDNLLWRTSPPEIKAVMAHELGHYVLNHIYKFMLALGMLTVAGFAFTHWAYQKIAATYGARWQIRNLADLASLPLLAAIISIYFFAATPIVNSLVREQEVEADIFGLNAAREADGFAEVDLKLIEYRKANPGPIEEFIFYDHPAPRKRVYAAMRWKAENTPDNKK